MLIGVGYSCRYLYSKIVSYLKVNCSRSITSVLFFLLSFSRNYVVSVKRGFLFLLVLGIGCVISLWLSLCIPYYFCGHRLCLLPYIFGTCIIS